MDTNEIIWKPIPRYEGRYEVSNTGLIKSVDRVIIRVDGMKQTWRGHPMKQRHNADGYLITDLAYGTGGHGKSTITLVHRCVAMAFIENPNGYRTVNHIDGNKENNNVSNLEWLNDSDNQKHAYRTGLRKPLNNPVRCIETGEIFESVKAVAIHYGVTRATIDYNINHGGGKLKDHHFEYINGKFKRKNNRK